MTIPWPDDREEKLRKLHADGMGYSQIADVLGDGITRNAVAGKVNRLGLGNLHPTEARKPRRLRRNAPQKLTALFNELAARDAPLAPKTQPVAPVMGNEPPVPKHLGIFELSSHTCRWPYNDVPWVTFCGHWPERDRPYCKFHCRMASGR